MDSTEAPSESFDQPSPTYDLPCDICRRRKVRCSKKLPCENCERAGAYCTYNDSARNVRRPPRHSELSLRLARLESLMRASSVQPKAGPPVNTNDIEQIEGFISSPGQQYPPTANIQPGRLGKLAYIDGKSRHIQSSFWPGMYHEVGHSATDFQQIFPTITNFIRLRV